MKNTKPQVVVGSSLKEIPDFYQIKLWHKGQKERARFGIMDQYSPGAKKAWKKRQLVIKDAISPSCYLVNADEVEIQPIDICGFENEYDKFIDSQQEKEQKVSDKIKGIKAGKLFQVGVADGYAYYFVVSVSKSKATIEWRGYSADRYVDNTFGFGGTFPLKCIEPHVSFGD